MKSPKGILSRTKHRSPHASHRFWNHQTFRQWEDRKFRPKVRRLSWQQVKKELNIE